MKQNVTRPASRPKDPLTLARACVDSPTINLSRLAEQTGLSRSWLHYLKAGKVTNCRLDQISALLHHFGHRLSVSRQ